MAPTSASSIQKRFKYDVFLSFRGEDTRKTFVDHLYLALHQRGINTYKDDERIEKGERISDQLVRSIEESRFHIIVFSKDYASSSWCLDELVKIMECQKTMEEQTAYPVFYDVDPTEVRKQRGAVGKALAKHGEKETVGRWRDALTEAANLSGWDVRMTGHEAKVIKLIVERVSLEIMSINLNDDDKLVGMKPQVKDVVSCLEIDSDDVRMIGITGMGGSGKTTLARAVFDHISIKFEGKSFVENVREASKGSLSGLKKLQIQVLEDVFNDKKFNVISVSGGKHMMKNMMHRKKVLVVLDDVDDINQLEALAGEHSWFKPGSRIIITTRDQQVLEAHGASVTFYVNLLSHKEAICLFSRYAFGKDTPIQEYEELSERVVRYAVGLPLTLKVLGSHLCDRTICEWVDAIARLKTIPLKQTLEKLELSFIGLENDQKEIFLDVACLLKGMKKKKAIKILESNGFHAEIGLRVLEQKSLISISDNGYLHLHDHIKEMGRNIVRRLHPDEPNRHTRLWVTEEIEDIFVNDLGTEATRSIKLSNTNLNPDIIMNGLTKMKYLRFLYVDNEYTTDVYASPSSNNYPSLPNALGYIYWRNYPLPCLPEAFQANNLVNLEMPHSNISRLWEEGERKVLNKLRFLDLAFSRLRTFDLGLTPNLEELNLRGYYDFIELHIPAECLKLKYLDLGGSKVNDFNLGLTPNLEELNLEGCYKFVELNMPSECPKLKYLNLGATEVRYLNLGLTPNLEKLNLRGCNHFVELHKPVECLQLKYLDLGGSKVNNFNLGLTPHLEELHLEKCNDLVDLYMPIECPKLKFLGLSGSKVSNLNLRLTPRLERLDLTNCCHLQEIHAPVGYFVVDKRIKSLGLESLSKLELMAEFIDKCPLHPNSNLPKFQFKCKFDEPLPSWSGNLEKLISFGLCACTNLESFSESICGLQQLGKLTLVGSMPEVPKNLNQLESLEELSLSMEEIKQLPDSICMLKHLKSLELKSCLLLERLPNDLGSLEGLEKLHITDCISLQEIPNSICEMKCLKYLHLPYCVLLGKLPDEVGRLECLEELNIEGTSIYHLPDSIFQLKDLCVVWSRGRLESCGFTSLKKLSKYTASCYIRQGPTTRDSSKG